MRRILSPLLFLLCGSVLASAQSVNPTEPFRAPLDLEPDTGAFGRTVALEMTGDPDLDAVVLDGTTPVLLSRPAFFDMSIPLATVANDIAALPDSFVTGKGALLVVGPDGLVRHYHQASTGSFQTQTLDDEDWVGALQVLVDQLNGRGKLDIIGLMSDGLTVRSLHNLFAHTWTAGPSFSLASQATAILLLDWNGDGVVDVAALTAAGVLLYDLSGNLLDAITFASTGGHLAALSLPGQTAQYVAWVTNDAATTWLLVAGSDGFLQTTDLGNIDAVGILGTDHDQDGDTDLLVSHKSERTYLLWDNTPDAEGPDFPLYEAYVLVSKGGTTAPLNEGTPVVADFDGDGDQDILGALEDSMMWYLFPGEAENENLVRPGVDDDGQAHLFRSEYGELDLQLLAPATIDSDATHLRIRVWRQGSPSTSVEVTLKSETDFDLSEIDWQDTLRVPLLVPTGTPPWEEVFWIEARIVMLDALGKVVAAWTPRIFCYTASGASLLTMQGRPCAMDPVTVPEYPTYSPDDGGGFTGSTPIGPFPPGGGP